MPACFPKASVEGRSGRGGAPIEPCGRLCLAMAARIHSVGTPIWWPSLCVSDGRAATQDPARTCPGRRCATVGGLFVVSSLSSGGMSVAHIKANRMTPATSTTKSLRPGASLFDDRWTAPNQPVPMLACRVADKTKAVAALNNAHSQALCRLRGGSADARVPFY